MKETITLNRPNWLGSEVGMVLKTITVSAADDTDTGGGEIVSAAEPPSQSKGLNDYVVENGRKIIKSGTLINDATLGYGLLYNDADVTDGPVVKSLMIRGSYIDSKLPTSVASYATTLASQGLFAVKYPETVIAYGEVK